MSIENQIEDQVELLELTSDAETRGFAAFLGKYGATNPQPRNGWQYYMMAIPMLAVMVVAAMRTGFQFYLAASTSATRFLGASGPASITVFSMIEAVLSVLGIEGMLVAFGIIRGYKTKKTTIKNTWIIIVTLVISTIAGLGQSIEIIRGLPESVSFVLQLGLALVTGIGVSFLAYFAAEYYGMLMASSGESYREWLQGAKRSWETSRDRKRLLKSAPTVGADQNIVEERKEEFSMPSATVVIDKYRQYHGIEKGKPVSAVSVAEWAYKAANRTPVNGDLNRLAGAIRVALSRERNKEGGPVWPTAA